MTDNTKFLEDFSKLSHDGLEMKYGIKFDTLRKRANKLGGSRKHFIKGRPPFIFNVNNIKSEYESGCTITSLSKKYKISRFIITGGLKKLNCELRTKNDKGWKRKYNFNEQFFNIIDTESKAYILGFIMADGCLYSGKKNCNLMRINIHKKDIEVLEFIKKEMESESPIKHLKNESIDLKLFSETMYDDLIKLGCTERKSKTLQFPLIRDNLLRHFVRGYFDGDGSVSFCIKNNKIKFPYWAIYSSKYFCSSLNKIMNEVLNTTIKKIIEHPGVYKVSYGSILELKSIYDWLYNDCQFFLKRKKEKMERIFNGLDCG